MATGAQTWSTTAASNNSIDTSVNWAEGQAPSTVNDSARAQMASQAMHIGDNAGVILTGGTTAAYTVTSKQVSTALVDGYTIAARFHATNEANATLNVDGVAAKNIQTAGGTNVTVGQIPAASVQRLTYHTSSTAWLLHGSRTIANTSVSSGSAAAPTITFTVDGDTGLYDVSPNVLGLTAGGAQTVSFSTSTVGVTGNVTISSSLDVSGSANFAAIRGASAILTSTLDVTGVTKLGAALTGTSATLSSSLDVSGATKVAALTGTSATITSSLNVSGATNLQALIGTSATLSSSLDVTGASKTASLTSSALTALNINVTSTSTTLPAYYFAADTDTGFHSPASNTAAIMVGGIDVTSVSTTGLAVTGTITTNGVAIPTANPPPALFKNLSIKVATNTTVTVAADFVSTTDGTSFLTTVLSGTVDLGSNGAVNKLDTGSIAIDTWYSIWAIAKSDGTTGALASASASSPTLPSGYTFKARIGWVKTIHGSATLYGTWQYGRKVQYVVGLAQTSSLPAISTSNVTGYSSTAPSWTAVTVNGGNVQQSFVPSTASAITLVMGNNGGSVQGLVAPNANYGGQNSTSPAPIMFNSTTLYVVNSGTFMLEATTVQVATNGAIYVFCIGWEDNI